MRKVVVFLAAAATATSLVTVAGAVAERPTGLQLTSKASIERYLASIGVDPRTVVVQQGQRNYAGPNCPGKRWSCTTASRVVQTSGGATDDNVFECSPARTGTNPATNTCVVVQTNASGANRAVCRMQTTGKTVAQSCSITQTNQQGTNLAQIDLLGRGRGGASQTTEQNVNVVQENGSGVNDVRSLQQVDQAMGAVEGGSQVQESHQALVSEQSSATGANKAQVKQFLLQAANAVVSRALSQRQNAVDAGPDVEARIKQTSASGSNESLLQQGSNLGLLARSNAGPVSQRQGAPTGGLDGTVDQSSSSPSTSQNLQDEEFNAHATTPPGTLTQVQFGPMECCTDQLGNANNRFDIRQESELHADGATQSSAVSAACTTSGTCNIAQHQVTDDENLTNSDTCTGSVESPCTAGAQIVCVPGEGCTTGEEEGPLSSLAKSVCNYTATYGSCPSFGTTTTGELGDKFKWRFVYTNGGAGTAHGVTITDVLPANTSFLSCSSDCSFDPYTKTVTWSLGDVAGEGTRSVTYLVKSSGETCEIANTGSVDTAEEAPQESNEASIFFCGS